MRKVLTGLITLALILVAAVTLLASDALGEQAALNQAQERRHAEELHQVELQAKREETRLALERDRQLQPVKAAATGMGIMGIVFTFGGLGYYVVQNMKKRSQLVYAGRDGQHPLVKVRTRSGTEVIHDPNRSPSATTVYTEDHDGNVVVMPVVHPQLEDAARAATRQAQAVQLMVAATHKGPALTEPAQDVAQRFLPGDDASTPSVKVLNSRTPALDRLLTDGEEDTDEPPSWTVAEGSDNGDDT